MARRRKGERVLGPYPIGKQWRVVVVGEGGERDSRFYPTEQEAWQVIRAVRKELSRTTEKTVQEARAAYEKYLREEKGNKPGSVDDTIYRLKTFFPDEQLLLSDLTAARCAGYYDALRERKTRNDGPFSVDSHRTMLAAAKTFFRWCGGKPRRWITRNPLDEVQGVGRRKHGKAQLRIDEARKWTEKAVELAEGGDAGAVAALMSLVMGMRASEIVSRIVRDLDDDARLLWIPDSKTEAGKRTLEVPELLRPYLRELAKGKAPEALLFGQHWRDWIRKQVKRICTLAKVPAVTAHGMRGLHGTMAVAAGATGHLVAASLGHDSFRTSKRSYVKREALETANQTRVLTVLSGGKLAS
jgi:integrase